MLQHATPQALATNNPTVDTRRKMKTFPQAIRGPRPRPQPHDRVLIGLGFTIALTLGACAKSGSNQTGASDFREESRAVLGTPSRAAADSGMVSNWAIVLESFTGATAQSQAQRRSAEISQEIGRNDVSVRSTPSGAAVVLGSYPRIDDPQARADLEWVRTLQRRGQRMFTRVFLAPPPSVSDPGAIPELSLQTARSTFGSRARYTLQVGVYELPDRAEAKRAAEQAALALRQEGTLAFYHHGPRRSMVTVGVFNEDDLGENFEPRSPTLLTLMQAYPLNLLNGHEVIERRGSAERKQPSLLVTIPD